MRVHLINPSNKSFGVGVITPRWLYVMAAATPAKYGDPLITDETLERFRPESVQRGDVVGIGIHTGNAARGMELGRQARESGAYVVYGGVYATLYPEEALETGGAHAVVKGDGDAIWGKVISDLLAGDAEDVYDGGRVPEDRSVAARWDLAPCEKYMWASVQTALRCPQDYSLFLEWRSHWVNLRPRPSAMVMREILDLRRRGFRSIALADDNFYPARVEHLRTVKREGNDALAEELQAIRVERLELMRKLSNLPGDMMFFTQLSIEAGEDIEFLDAMCKAHIQGVLVGEPTAEPAAETVSPELNSERELKAERLQAFQEHGIQILGSFTYSSEPGVWDDSGELTERVGITFAHPTPLTAVPAIDFNRLKGVGGMSLAWTEYRLLAG